jgi:HAD superfamily hydrolase (TIGR01509 family)
VADPFELVIFDCDGVLVDSERLAVRVESDYLSELGWPLSQEEIVERFMGGTDQYMDDAIQAQLGDRLPADWKEEFRRRYREAYRAGLVPVDGVLEALDQIEATTPTCVASSGSHDKLRFTLGLTGLYRRFEGRVFSGYEVANGKPAPDLFLHAAARMGAAPARCAVVEDSRFGVMAARAAGMHAFGYAGGLTGPERLEGPRTVVFEDMRALPRLLARGVASTAVDRGNAVAQNRPARRSRRGRPSGSTSSL